MIEEAINKYDEILMDEQKEDELKILRNINISFIQVLNENSKVLMERNHEWELLRGIYNRNFNLITKVKEEQDVIDNLWNFCYMEIRSNIWLKCCEEVIDLEKEKGIDNKMK